MPTQPAKNYVLLHGAFHGAWCWKEVASRLRAAGHVVVTPTLTGLGERSHLLKLTPHPFRTYFDRLHLQHALGNGVAVTYIACTAPLYANTAGSRELARGVPGWTYLEIPTAHDAMLLMPDEVARLLAAID